jgi:hypothetical protein
MKRHIVNSVNLFIITLNEIHDMNSKTKIESYDIYLYILLNISVFIRLFVYFFYIIYKTHINVNK